VSFNPDRRFSMSKIAIIGATGRAGSQLLDTRQGSQPVLVRLRRLGIGHPHVQVLRHNHAADHRLDRRDPYETAVRLRPVQADHLQGLPFQGELVALQHIRHDHLLRLVGAHLGPPVGQLARHGLLDMRHRGSRGQHLGFGVGTGQGLQAEVVVRVTMADIDGGEALAAGAQLVQHLLGLRLAELRIHQDRLALAADDHRTYREQRRFARVVDVQRQR